MLVSYKWLKTYVDFPWLPEDLAHRLTMAGLEVEGIEDLGADLQNVVVGKVISVEPHPNADKLSVCQVEADGEYTIVCGAPNVAPGILAPLALTGAVLPGGFKIKKAKLRGVESFGMLCSGQELGLPSTDGLMLLTEGTPGEPLAEALGLDDWVLDISVLANRPDCLSMIGIAREVAALADTALKLPIPELKEAGEAIEGRAKVVVEAPELCPRYMARLFTDLKIGPSPSWMQQRLIASGMRPINNIVDITNYVMLEYGQPLHAFDYETLSQGTIVVRTAKEGEKMVTLDDVERKLNPQMLVIADAEKPACIAGIMGSEWAEVTAETTQVLLEAASFSRSSIRRTSRSLGLASESSHRFERGVDPYLQALAIERAGELFEKYAVATTAKGRIDQLSPKARIESKPVEITEHYITSTLGVEIPDQEVGEIFRRLDLPAEKLQNSWQVQVPPRRADLERSCDLLEEIARIWGFEKVPAQLPQGAGSQGGAQSKDIWQERVRRTLIELGFSEALSYGFFGPKSLQKMSLEGTELFEAIPITNPLSEDQSLMRTTLLPRLLEAAAHNRARQEEDLALFEIGSVFKNAENPTETRALGIVLAGKLEPHHWQEPGKNADFYTMKGIVTRCLQVLGIEQFQVALPEPGSGILGLYRAFHPGRSATLIVGEQVVGVFGELAPGTAKAWELERGVLAAELDLETLWPLRRTEGLRVEPLPRFPSSSRDLALLVPEELPAQEVEALIDGEGGKLLQEVKLFDLYAGSQVPEGLRSLAYSLKFGSKERTITEKEIEALEAKIINKLKEQGISLRK